VFHAAFGKQGFGARRVTVTSACTPVRTKLRSLGRRCTTPLLDLLIAAELLATGEQVVLAGDYNVMPTELDVYKPERWLDDALFRPEVRAAFRELVAQGWTDALRTLHPAERIYTFWDYFRNAWARNAGLRIDHLLLSPAVARRLVAAGVDREVRGWGKASDHAPAWIELGDGDGVRAQSRRRRLAPTG
jgi:exodeoxyribonuclease III